MFESFGRSWQLVKASWAVLKADKELMWFPVLSGIVTIIISFVMLIPSIAVAVSLGVSGAAENVSNVVGYIGLFLFYLVTYTISIYFNTALIGAAMIRMDGGDPTMRDGLRIANARLMNIIVYAGISATVGMVIRILQERGGIFGNILAFLGGIAWNLATFLVIPIMVARNISPWDAIQHSARMLKKTWGEQITGGFSLGGIFTLLYLAIIFGGIFLVVGLGALTESGMLAFVLIVLLVFAVIALAIVQGALSGIFQAALYRYAATGVAPDQFDLDLMQGAFKPKRKRG